MSTLQIPSNTQPFTVDLSALLPQVRMSDEQFFELFSVFGRAC